MFATNVRNAHARANKMTNVELELCIAIWPGYVPPSGFWVCRLFNFSSKYLFI